MRGLGRISIRSVHARDIGGIEFWWMQVLEVDPRRSRGFDMFEETLVLYLHILLLSNV